MIDREIKGTDKSLPSAARFLRHVTYILSNRLCAVGSGNLAKTTRVLYLQHLESCVITIQNIPLDSIANTSGESLTDLYFVTSKT